VVLAGHQREMRSTYLTARLLVQASSSGVPDRTAMLGTGRGRRIIWDT
jgi:hypothetical protein